MSAESVDPSDVLKTVKHALHHISDRLYHLEVENPKAPQLIQLIPLVDGCARVAIEILADGVDVSINGSEMIEIAAPVNVNYGGPERSWQEDLGDVIKAVTLGQLDLYTAKDGSVHALRFDGLRLNIGDCWNPSLSRVRPSAWQSPKGA